MISRYDALIPSSAPRTISAMATLGTELKGDAHTGSWVASRTAAIRDRGRRSRMYSIAKGQHGANCARSPGRLASPGEALHRTTC